MINPERLHTTNFAKYITDDSRNVLMRVYAAQKADKSLESSEREEYIHQVLDSFTELQETVDCLDMAEIFLKSYYVSKTWKDKYDQHHYFRYHYEAWVLNAIRVYERLLILINSVYWLEIPHKEVTYRSVSEHEKLRGTKLLRTLNKIHGALNELQRLKNIVFHLYAYTDEDLKQIKTFSMIARHGKDEEKETYSILAKFQMKYQYLPDKKKEVEANNQQILKIVDAVFNALEGQYLQFRDGSDNTLRPKTKRE